jgi:aconitate hydratase
LSPHQRIEIEARSQDGALKPFAVTSRLDNQMDVDYLRHGGVLPMVLRDLMKR